ncbi:adenylyl-sulfate kinase [Aeromonas diversa]|uniref:Adenylylsulfate kinase n=1 Tax=Aeromonas diversa CDC 2478-85 TaxID=1268237 RepID=N9TXN0_9GAMM|nr:adenylyl-sulfate kinase [Aeromonas diversa]ENY70805.1 adenylylsulfate kinase [Aeromonas diversa CDC 2478-85]
MTKKGKVIWLTGLSGAGKTTLARRVVSFLKSREHAVIMLDGDELRAIFAQSDSNGSHHSAQKRLELALRYCALCKLLSEQGITVVIATISLFHKVHKWNRLHLPNYIEIYLKVPIEELKRRDPKGIYSSYEAGDTRYVAGIDVAVEEPQSPNLTLSFQSGDTVDKYFDTIIEYILDSEIKYEDITL